MDDQSLKQLGVTVKTNVPLARHTTFKVGGPARFFVIPQTKEEMVKVLKWCEGEGAEHMIVGGGSNMLVSDEGFDGVVIHPEFKTVSVEGEVVRAEAGALTVEAARKSVEAGLTGFEWGVGVPGTIGGAVRGNAGCMGREMKDIVEWVEAYCDGEVVRLAVDECAFGYRDSIFKHGGGVVLAAGLRLAPDVSKNGAKKMIEFLQYRTKTQPKIPSSGCIFKNVPFAALPPQTQARIPDMFREKGRVPAGWLVQEADCKGMRVGGAAVSELHGNFIVNDKSATASDILQLIAAVKGKVGGKFGVALEEEIQIV